MIPAIAIISRLSCLQGTHRSFKYFPKNALLSFCRHMKSAVHVPYAGWFKLILTCSALARTYDFKKTLMIGNQSKCSAARPSPALIISLIVCAVLRLYRWLCVQSSGYANTLAPSVISSHECAYLSLRTCKSLFLFLHFILCCPSSNCISHAIIKCRMTILISYFPCLTARFFPRKDCSIRPLAPPFADLRIWNSLILQNVISLIRRFFSMRFYFDQEGCCPHCNPLSEYVDGLLIRYLEYLYTTWNLHLKSLTAYPPQVTTFSEATYKARSQSS